MTTSLVPLPARNQQLIEPIAEAEASLRGLWVIAFGNLKESSKRAYRTRLADFAHWRGIDLDVLPAVIIGSSAAAFHADVYAYRDYLSQSALSAATRNLALAALGRLVSQLHGRQLIGWTLSVRGFKARKLKDTAGPPESVVRSMLETLHGPGCCEIRAARDTAVIRLAVSLGLRRSEIVQLDLDDVTCDDDGSICIAIREKGGDEPRSMAVPARAGRALQAWLALRRHFGETGTSSGGPAPCFIRLTHAAMKRRSADRLTDEGVAHLLDQVRRKAGVERRVPAHSLRHRAITSLLESGASLTDAVAFARHSDPKTTMIYWDNAQQAAKKSAEAVDRLF